MTHSVWLPSSDDWTDDPVRLRQIQERLRLQGSFLIPERKGKTSPHHYHDSNGRTCRTISSGYLLLLASMVFFPALLLSTLFYHQLPRNKIEQQLETVQNENNYHTLTQNVGTCTVLLEKVTDFLSQTRTKSVKKIPNSVRSDEQKKGPTASRNDWVSMLWQYASSCSSEPSFSPNRLSSVLLSNGVVGFWTTSDARRITSQTKRQGKALNQTVNENKAMTPSSSAAESGSSKASDREEESDIKTKMLFMLASVYVLSICMRNFLTFYQMLTAWRRSRHALVTEDSIMHRFTLSHSNDNNHGRDVNQFRLSRSGNLMNTALVFKKLPPVKVNYENVFDIVTVGEAITSTTNETRTSCWFFLKKNNAQQLCCDETCPICLNNFEEKELVTSCKYECGNWFHKDCLFQWLDRSTDCPCCRTDMLAKYHCKSNNDSRTRTPLMVQQELSISTS